MIYNAEQIKHTLSTILYAQEEWVAAEVLDKARAEISYIGQDFSIDSYSLDLRIPAMQFARLDKFPKNLDRATEKIRDKLWKLGVDPDGSTLSQVRILPEMSVGPGAAEVATPTATDESRIWHKDRLRLFLSHVSAARVQASTLKETLRPFGIDAFVAHEDIEPNADWRKYIEFALRSMHALVALVTPDFPDSLWCDQEVGFGLGRGVPVISVNWGKAPHGFIGKQQAIRGNFAAPAGCAEKIFETLIKQPQLESVLAECLVLELIHAPNHVSAKTSTKQLVNHERLLSKDQVKRLWQAVGDNPMVGEATNVSRQIENLAKRAEVILPAKVAEEFDDDIPF